MYQETPFADKKKKKNILKIAMSKSRNVDILDFYERNEIINRVFSLTETCESNFDRVRSRNISGRVCLRGKHPVYCVNSKTISNVLNAIKRNDAACSRILTETRKRAKNINNNIITNIFYYYYYNSFRNAPTVRARAFPSTISRCRPRLKPSTV